MGAAHQLVLRGGRVIDPESGLDAVRDVAVDAGRVSAISADPLDGDVTVDTTGLVVAPGFVDLHSHAHTLAGRRLQACDGVTTSLDLEAGRAPAEGAYALEARRGSPINYGFSASWAAARMNAVAGVELDGTFRNVVPNLGRAEWQREATGTQVFAILERLRADLAAGAVGIGLLMGYAPGVDPEEYILVARLAASAGVPTFTHCRDIVEFTPTTRIDGTEEIVRAAGETGAHMHHCHVNSTSGRHIDRVLGVVERCRAAGGKVSTEAYPYGSAATAIGAAFLDPDRLEERGMKPSSLTYLPTGERIADAERLRALRAADPGGGVIVEFLDENNPSDFATLRRSLLFEDSIVASDGMPTSSAAGWSDTSSWPVPPDQVTHPRTAGTFSKALRLWRQEGTPVAEAIRRCTLLPAKVLEGCAPVMKGKGRVQVGSDADLVVFDADNITDQATYTDSTRPSSGIAHVLVAGTFVVRNGELMPDALPGQAVRAVPA